MEHRKTPQIILTDKMSDYGQVIVEGKLHRDYTKSMDFYHGAMWAYFNPEWFPVCEGLPLNQEGGKSGRSIRVLGLTRSGQWMPAEWDYKDKRWVVSFWPGLTDYKQKDYFIYWLRIVVPKELLEQQ